MDIMTILSRMAVGAVAGATFAVSAYWKRKPDPTTDERSNFSWFRFSKTVVLGAFIGVGSEFTGMPMTETTAFFGTFGLTAGIENGIKIVWRRLFGK